MQREAVETSVRLLREHAEAETGGLPVGQARGRIILPCGTGKTRIALHITEELTGAGQLAVVLCPSIALVAQIRREFLSHKNVDMRALAVCSDQTAGYDPKREDSAKQADDPTRDTSNVSANDLKGQVTTDATEIAKWISDGTTSDRVSVIFGTYQSAGRVAQAITKTGAQLQLLVCDEAHRTASLRRKRSAKPEEDARLREFTLCHDQEAFPARYRVYQTATPRIYNHKTSTRRVDPNEFIVRSMDDETTFGVELYRRSYVDAVENGWLSDYRIIALGVSDQRAYEIANDLAREAPGKTKRNQLTTSDHIRGLALALVMAGGTRAENDQGVAVNSCIAFMNTVNKSKQLAENLQTAAVREWLADRLEDRAPAEFKLEHLDASNNVTEREEAKRRLAEANNDNPHGIINVGIFGEGTDSPSLNAVAFLEPRRSPIDVVQAVGRAMRTSPGKQLGYVICPVLIPPNESDPEWWLSNARPEEGWTELGQILLALRAHDDRIEHELASLLQIHIPPSNDVPQPVRSIVAIPSRTTRRIRYGEHTGPQGTVYDVVEAAAASNAPLSQHGIRPLAPEHWTADTEPTGLVTATPPHDSDSPAQLRQSTPERDKPTTSEPRGKVNVDKTKKQARKMINEGAGQSVPSRAERAARKRRRAEQLREDQAHQMLSQVGSVIADDIAVNLLANSGLRRNRVDRDLNILEESVKEAAHNLRSDELQAALDAHFGLDQLAADKRKEQADGCTIAALLLMNAAMLHQRIAAGGWLRDVEPLSAIKNETAVVEKLKRNWDRITRQDFLPVIEPAQEAIFAIEDTARLAGLERALRHLAAEAERIAATYADMGADHAGPLFNKVMGNQASDGAYFTRPPAAAMAARLTLDACGPQDWTDPQTWRNHKTVDLACGSGTLLAALLTDMKRRAREQGASEQQVAGLQKLAVEEVLKGMDINPVSLQLAATQLTTGNADIKYSRMGLYRMPYGPTGDPMVPTAAGSLELIAEEEIVPQRESEMFASAAQGEAARLSLQDPEVERAAIAARAARIAIMNPPFTERKRMGEKFPNDARTRIRARVDGLENIMVVADPELGGFVSKRSIGPMFVALAELCVMHDGGVLSLVHPTVALTGPSGLRERQVLAQRFDLDTVLTCHQPNDVNLAQHSNMHESVVVLRRREGEPKPTRIIALDRFPNDDTEVAGLFDAIGMCGVGDLADGWGEVSEWPAERSRQGDWSAAAWRSPELADAATRLAEHSALRPMASFNTRCHMTTASLSTDHRRASPDEHGAFPVLERVGADGQQCIEARPDGYWLHKRGRPSSVRDLAGYLLVVFGQGTSTGRLAAVASHTAYVGYGWSPVGGVSEIHAKALAVFLNSTPGRLLLLRRPGRTLSFPQYAPALINELPVPDITDATIRSTLLDCWEATRDMQVPQYRDGECEVRQVWDAAVCEALGWDEAYIASLRKLLHEEPHVRGLGYGQYSD